MSLYFDTDTLHFMRRKESAHHGTAKFTVPGKVASVDAVVKSFSARYTEGEHQLNTLAIQVGEPSVRVGNRKTDVSVEVEYELHDSDWNDNFEGEIVVLLIAEIEDSQQG